MLNRSKNISQYDWRAGSVRSGESRTMGCPSILVGCACATIARIPLRASSDIIGRFVRGLGSSVAAPDIQSRSGRLGTAGEVVSPNPSPLSIIDAMSKADGPSYFSITSAGFESNCSKMGAVSNPRGRLN